MWKLLLYEVIGNSVASAGLPKTSISFISVVHLLNDDASFRIQGMRARSCSGIEGSFLTECVAWEVLPVLLVVSTRPSQREQCPQFR